MINHIYRSIGEDVHEGKTGIADDYHGSISQYAPENDNLLRRLQQVDPAHDDRDTSQYQSNGALFLNMRFSQTPPSAYQGGVRNARLKVFYLKIKIETPPQGNRNIQILNITK